MKETPNLPPTPPTGLTDEMAAGRRANIVTESPDKTVWQILAGNLFTPFNALNVALALCLALVGSWRNMLFMGVVFSNTLIGTVQELRARRTIRKLSLLHAPQAHVLRGGTERVCRPEELVLGDLIVLRAGDQIPADAVVTGGSGAADESLLTGESDAIAKQEGDTLLSGSCITEGRIVARLIRVGDDSYAARLTRSAKEIRRPKSALMLELNNLVRFVSCILIPLGLLLFCREYFVDHVPLTSAVPSTVAAMIGMIPEGLLLLTSVAMLVGVVKLGQKHNTLVQELYGIETLARADVLCLDKTGTLTTGRMTVKALLPLQAEEEELRASLSRFLGAMDEKSTTLDALRAAVPPGQEEPVATLPFSSARKKSAAAFHDGTTLVLGAPDFVLTPEQLAPLAQRIADQTAQGFRVLVLAGSDGVITETGELPVQRVLGLCVLQDELRPNVRETLAYFRQQGVSLRVISGDDPRTVAAVARLAGLEGEAVDATTLSDADLPAATERYAVFGRVTPVQKKLLVSALRQHHSVAMAGDGVNDLPALKMADCSIAMPGGAQAVRQVAQLSLLDGDFQNLPHVVAEGRRVVGNVTRAASLFLIKTLYSFAISLLVLFLPVAYPFMPVQLTLISTLTVGIPCFFLALERNESRLQGSFLRQVLLRALPGATAVTLCAVVAMLAHRFLGWTDAECSTLATIATGAIGLMSLLSVCIPLTRMRLILLLTMTAAFLCAVVFFGPLFFLTPLTLVQFNLLLVLIGLSAVLMGLMTAGVRRWNARHS